ncbi:MAG TPA: hypothetical protein VL523_00105 [Terriglobia bacterium]|nr:hypothetical protein [Terriglobia bacterium]
MTPGSPFGPSLVPGSTFTRERRSAKIKNITNEPTNLLKTLIFHFWKTPKPTKLFKTKVIRLLSNHHAEKNGDSLRASLKIGPHSSETDRFGGRKSTCKAGTRGNKEYYERTRQVTENINVPFFGFAGTRQLIENRHDTLSMPSGCWKQEGYMPCTRRKLPSLNEAGAILGFSRHPGRTVAHENLESYERTQHLAENNHIPFLEVGQTQHVIDNRIVISVIPVSY